MADGLKVTPSEAHRGEPLASDLIVSIEYDTDDVDADYGSAPTGGRDQWKQPVRVATTANVTIASALNSGDTLDGVTLAAGDRVLVKDQSDASENGIYVVDSSPYRAEDMDEDAEVLGAVVYVIAGTANAGTAWAVDNATEPTVDTDDIDWSGFGGGGSSGSANDTTLNTVAASGSTETLDVSVARTHDVTLTADCTFTFSGAVTGESWGFHFILREDGTGGWHPTWPGAVTWAGGTPTLVTTAGAVEEFYFWTVDGGTTWVGHHLTASTSSVADLDDLGDVDTSGVSDGDVLTYDLGTTTWVAAAPSGSASTRWEPVIFDNAGTPEIVYTDDGGTWDIVMHEVPI